MIKVPDWLIYALICSLLYGLWRFLGNLATKYVASLVFFIALGKGEVANLVSIPKLLFKFIGYP